MSAAQTSSAFSTGYWATTDDGSWCPTCNLPSAVVVERRIACVDLEGASSVLAGAYLYCFQTGHEDFIEVIR